MSKSKVTISAADISDNWAGKMKSSVSRIQKGIDGVTENPAELAAAQQDKMKTNLNAAIDSGRWAAGLSKVTLADWKGKTKTKVGTNLSSGVDAALPKRRAFDQYLVSTLNGVLPTIKGMPDQTISDSVERVRALMEHMHNNPYKK